MKHRHWLAAAALAAFSQVAVAAPSISVVDNSDGTGSLNITTDAPGALAAELALELTGGVTLVDAVINSAIFDQANPGDSPFVPGSPVQGDAHGLELDLVNNRLFAAFGAEDPGVGTFEFLTFSYTGSGGVQATGYVAQNGELGSFLDTGGPISPPLPGDFDGNGSWGDGDLTLLLANWGATVPPVPAGWDGLQPTAPGIGDDELTTLLSNWGQSSSLAVPEPGAVVMALLATICLGLPRSATMTT